MDWFNGFWGNHGERLVFMALATAFGIGFCFWESLAGEGKTILVMVAGILVNKVRGPMEPK
jgi:hypothetical protein